MSKVLKNLKYAKSHEWVSVDGDVALVGITDYAQDTLGSIVYLEVGEVGDNVKQFKEFGVVESVKAASDLLAPISGEIIEVNSDLLDKPETINSDPYGSWMIKVKVKDIDELNKLLDDEQYLAECE